MTVFAVRLMLLGLSIRRHTTGKGLVKVKLCLLTVPTCCCISDEIIEVAIFRLAFFFIHHRYEYIKTSVFD